MESNYNIESECFICLDDKYHKINLNCNRYVSHYMCKECYTKYLNISDKCPLCRNKINYIIEPEKSKPNNIFTYKNFLYYSYLLIIIIGYIVGVVLCFSIMNSIISDIKTSMNITTQQHQNFTR